MLRADLLRRDQENVHEIEIKKTDIDVLHCKHVVPFKGGPAENG
jgi:hypothetical protein